MSTILAILLTMSKLPKSDEIIVHATVTEALPNTMFRVRVNNFKKPLNSDTDEQGHSQSSQPEEFIAYLGGRMKFNRIKVLVGDSVQVLLDPYGGKGRIVKRG